MDDLPTVCRIIGSIAEDVPQGDFLKSLHHIDHRLVVTYVIRGNRADYHLSRVRTHANMYLAPRPTFGITMLSDLPFTFTKNFNPRRVKNHIQIFARFEQFSQWDPELFGSTRKHRVVRTH